MDRLTREEVIHVSNLAKIGVSEEDIDNYAIELKKMIDEIDKIKNIEDFIDDDMLITPTDNKIELEKLMVEVKTLEINEFMKNVPNRSGNFIEVPVMLNE